MALQGVHVWLPPTNVRVGSTCATSATSTQQHATVLARRPSCNWCAARTTAARGRCWACPITISHQSSCMHAATSRPANTCRQHVCASVINPPSSGRAAHSPIAGCSGPPADCGQMYICTAALYACRHATCTRASPCCSRSIAAHHSPPGSSVSSHSSSSGQRTYSSTCDRARREGANSFRLQGKSVVTRRHRYTAHGACMQEAESRGGLGAAAGIAHTRTGLGEVPPVGNM